MYRGTGAISVPMMNPKSILFVYTTSKQTIYVRLEIGWKTLKPGVIPSIFNLKNPSKIKPRKSPKKRYLPVTNESTDNDSYLEEELEGNNSNE